MFYSTDDAVNHIHLREVRVTKPARWVDVVFPAAQTAFYEEGLTDFGKALYSTVIRESVTVDSSSRFDAFIL